MAWQGLAWQGKAWRGKAWRGEAWHGKARIKKKMKIEIPDEQINQLRKRRCDLLVKLFEDKDYIPPDMIIRMVFEVRSINEMFKWLDKK